jgi:hypothetical protein
VASPLVLDPAKLNEQPKPQSRPGPLPPFVFKHQLPQTPVGSIDGKDVTQEQLLRHLLKGNWQIVINTLILANLLDMELKKANITLTDEEIVAEQDKILQRTAPGKTSAQVKEMGVFSDAEVRRQAWLSRGWDRIFLAEQKIRPWRDMTIVVPPDGEAAGFSRRNIDRALAKGLTFRPLDDTIRATLEYNNARSPEDRTKLDSGLVGGISASREAEVLAAWHAKEKT